MTKHLDDVARNYAQQNPRDRDGGIPGWALPVPKFRPSTEAPLRCDLCDSEHKAPVDHLSRVHGIDLGGRRYSTSMTFIRGMNADVVVQHLRKDEGELNSLRNDIREVERQLQVIDRRYRSKHNLPVDTIYYIDHNSLYNTSRGVLDQMLFNLREAGNQKGTLHFSHKLGTYSEVLADLEQVRAKWLAAGVGQQELGITPCGPFRSPAGPSRQ